MPKAKVILKEELILVDQEHPERHLEQIEKLLIAEGNVPDPQENWNEDRRYGCKAVFLADGVYTFFRFSENPNWGKTSIRKVKFVSFRKF